MVSRVRHTTGQAARAAVNGSGKNVAAMGSQVGDGVSSSTDDAVFFQGDGERHSPEATIRLLAEYQESSGIAPDSYSLGGTVEALEQAMARYLGKEAALFVPTGTLANHLAIRKH